MIEHITTAFVLLAYLAFASKRLLTYMHAFQQEEYDNGRFLAWIFRHKVFDTRMSLLLIIIGGASLIVPPLASNFATFAAFLLIAYFEKDPRKEAKKKLALTNRVKRTLTPAIIILALLAIPNIFLMPWSWIISVQLIPFILVLSNMLLSMTEKKIQNDFMQEAKNKIQDLNPKIIAITGSFGKTSVKHILGHILRTQGATLITPGSVNTPMGITRVIREDLNESHRYFVVEMGAYGPGSIARLCALTPPNMGIITAIGHAHYERFGTMENVAQAKYELAEDVLSRKGKVIVHERTLRYDHPRHIRDTNSHFFTVCGESFDPQIHKTKEEHYLTKDDLEILDVEQLVDELEVNINWKEKFYSLRAPLFGLHHGHNIALAFATAIELGIDPEFIKTALKSIPQIPHRLEVKPQADGTTIIDDAYNSNPTGFAMALDLLNTLTEKQNKNGRKILITPGMVELGGAHDKAHHTAGRHAGKICDITIVVNPDRIPTFIDGFYETGTGKTLVEVKSFADAADRLSDFKRVGDIVLLENDLPDIYERIPKL